MNTIKHKLINWICLQSNKKKEINIEEYKKEIKINKEIINLMKQEEES
jgi:hypothetical protein